MKTTRGTQSVRTSICAGLAMSAAALIAGCQEGAVAEPTWIEDVRPIALANCARCHTFPSIGGAPNRFRLDKYDDTVLLDGTVIHGAHAMSEFMAARAGTLGDMPPDYQRTDGQRDTLINWQEASTGGVPPRGDRADNREPDATAFDVPGTADNTPVVIAYEISDPDGDPVDGALYVRGAGQDRMIDDRLHSGRGRARWDPATFAPGTYELVAVLSDDLAMNTERVLGSVAVTHAGGNTLPVGTFVSPTRDQLIGPIHSPFPIVVDVADAEPDGICATFTAVRGDQELPIAENVTAVGGQATASWDISQVDDAPNWRVRAVLFNSADCNTNSSETTEVLSESVIVSNVGTNLSFAEVQPIFVRYCTACHPGRGIAGLTHDFGRHFSDESGKGVDETRGLIYRRLIQQRNMPPPSAKVILPEIPDVTDADRATLEAYLLGGAPP